jgi:hypothetical protein
LEQRSRARRMRGAVAGMIVGRDLDQLREELRFLGAVRQRM